jgi:polyisoprenyl-phosphate glycosyltransferase
VGLNTTFSAAVSPELEQKIKLVQGPILVLGGSGFIGANLTHCLLKVRDDVCATATRLPAWRLSGLPSRCVRVTDLLVDSNLDQLLEEIKPRTVFDCIAYGAYSFETDSQLIYQTNFNFTSRLLARLERRKIFCYVHAGSSSEYGDNAAAPLEVAPPAPNSDYAVSKVAAAQLLYYFGKKKKLPCANLRLYSVYGPLEDSSRLIPNVLRCAAEKKYPPLVNQDISRDFIYVDDASQAFIETALQLKEDDWGESFNIGTGTKTTIGEVAALAKRLFDIPGEPTFSMPNRTWDMPDWYGNVDKAGQRLGWKARVEFADGLERMARWYCELPDKAAYQRSSKKFGLDTRHSVSAIVACHNDDAAIEPVYQRLTAVFTKLNVDYQIIFVDDCSTDGSEERLRALSRNDRRVTAVTHSRNFGRQAGYRSGMEIASKNSCVLIPGTLEDPPELIEQFVALWRQGYDVVYGRRQGASGSLVAAAAYKAFHYAFDLFSYLSIPHDAGDFGLLDKRVVQSLLQFPERDMFLTGIRAFAGFKQIGADYRRASAPAGISKGGIVAKMRRAKRGLLGFSNVPLSMLTLAGIGLMLVSLALGVIQILVRILYPNRAASGITTVLLAILVFGSINLLAVALVGEYVGRIFDEVKQRPHFIRRSFIKDGEIRPAAEALRQKEV